MNAPAFVAWLVARVCEMHYGWVFMHSVHGIDEMGSMSKIDVIG